MSLQTRRELLERVAPRYRGARYREKSVILSEFVAATGYGRKYATLLLNGHGKTMTAPAARTRARRYDEPVQAALVTVWKAANCICSKRLVPFLPEMVAAMERCGHLSLGENERQRLLSLSVSTADRLLARERRGHGHGVSTTRPGQLLKRQIAIRTFTDWSDLRPGFVEADLVAHCGERPEGAFLNTLVLTDIATGWTECLALRRRSEADVAEALAAGRQWLPFPLLGLDTDNGGEFINYQMLHYCTREGITFTRSRPYKKNDQAHVEEKNGSVVRRLIGYDRYEGVAAWLDLEALYRVLRLYVNFFQPSLKLISKQRQGSHVTKHYDKALTPHQRVLASDSLATEIKDQLQREYEQLDPVALLGQMERLQDRFWQHAWKDTSQGSAASDWSTSAGACSAVIPAATPAGLSSPPWRDVSGKIGNQRQSQNQIQPPQPPTTMTTATRSLPTASVATVAHQDNDNDLPGLRKYRRTRKTHVPHTWRTRADPFADVWRQLELQLTLHPSQTSRQLLTQLQNQYPGQFPDSQLRTLQRRVEHWRVQRIQQEQTAAHVLATEI